MPEEFITISEASSMLGQSEDELNELVSKGELKAYRETNPEGRQAWVVELPEDGWTSAATAVELGREFSPWWWADEGKTGKIHYVEVLTSSALEEIMPEFLCGFVSDNVWFAKDLQPEDLCPQCFAEAKGRSLPLT